MLEEIPAPLALIFGGYVIGAGYLALLSLLGAREFKRTDTFDKFFISLIFGILSFSLCLMVFNLDIELDNQLKMIEFLRGYYFFFIIQVLLARTLILLWSNLQIMLFETEMFEMPKLNSP